MMKYLNNCKIIVRAMSKNIVSRWNFKKIELIIHSIYPLFMNELFGFKNYRLEMVEHFEK